MLVRRYTYEGELYRVRLLRVGTLITTGLILSVTVQGTRDLLMTQWFYWDAKTTGEEEKKRNRLLSVIVWQEYIQPAAVRTARQR